MRGGVDKLFNSRRSSAIVLYMALAAITGLCMYTIPTAAVYRRRPGH